jgi:acetyl-CoA acetyltransferase
VRDDVVVVGIGMLPFGRYPDRTISDLSRDAIWAAIHDAGVDPRAIDAGWVANCYHGFFTGQVDAIAPLVFRYAGLGGFPMMHVSGGSGAGVVAFHDAVLGVAAEQYRLALVVGVEKQYVPGDPARSISAIATSGEQRVALEMGLTWVGDLGMGARRLMRRYGWTAEDFALVAEKNRRHGSLNPLAELQEPISAAEVLAARVVAEPLTRPMCASAAVDGAAALLVCTAETARRLVGGTHPRLAAMSLKGGRYVRNGEDDTLPGMISMNDAPEAFAEAYEHAGVGPDDVELAQIHDAVAPEELLAYQVLGLAAPGEEPALLRSGATALGGRVPVNTDGGLLARGHAIPVSGIAQIHETVVQLRGQAGPRQVRRGGDLPRLAAVQNAGAQGGPKLGGVAVSAALLFSR